MRAGHWAREALLRALGLAWLRSVPVAHCSDAHGLALGFASGWSLVYSGDTRQPCQALLEARLSCCAQTLRLCMAIYAQPGIKAWRWHHQQLTPSLVHALTARIVAVCRPGAAARC